jgi:hypothetical protein
VEWHLRYARIEFHFQAFVAFLSFSWKYRKVFRFLSDPFQFIAHHVIRRFSSLATDGDKLTHRRENKSDIA